MMMTAVYVVRSGLTGRWERIPVGIFPDEVAREIVHYYAAEGHFMSVQMMPMEEDMSDAG